MTAAGFAARAAACAQLWSCGEIDLQSAVDRLQAVAERNGLVKTAGQDAVQAMIAKAFAPYRRGKS